MTRYDIPIALVAFLRWGRPAFPVWFRRKTARWLMTLKILKALKGAA